MKKNKTSNDVKERYLTEVEAARILGVSRQSLSNWRCQGNKGPVYVKKSRMIRYPESCLYEYMNAGLINPEAQREVL